MITRFFIERLVRKRVGKDRFTRAIQAQTGNHGNLAQQGSSPVTQGNNMGAARVKSHTNGHSRAGRNVEGQRFFTG